MSAVYLVAKNPLCLLPHSCRHLELTYILVPKFLHVLDFSVSKPRIIKKIRFLISKEVYSISIYLEF